jgi:uncharacterized membrane protein YkvA (DUF1232 family)
MNWFSLLQLRRVLRRRPLTPWGRMLLILRLPSMMRLSLALFRDVRVPLAAKAVALATIALALSPLDLPAYIPIAGQAWDVAVITLVLDVFVQTCPRDVVREHVARLGLQNKFMV